MKKGIKDPVIVNFGPGGSVHFLAHRLPVGRTADLSSKQKFVRVFESFLRKTGLFRLKTNEPAEILRTFEVLNPSRMIVVDREKKVIKAAGRLAEEQGISIPIEAELRNLQHKALGKEGDIVVALNIVARTSDPGKTIENIVASTKKGGLICINIDDAPDGFTKLGHCLFERDK